MGEFVEAIFDVQGHKIDIWNRTQRNIQGN